MVAKLSRGQDRQRIQSVQARDRKRRPSLESLEARQLMTLGGEFFFPVNTTTRNNQFNSDVASSSSGNSVVVWTDTFSSTDHDIRAQRLDSTGSKLGPEIVVSFSSLDEDSARVAIDARGNFVVTWVQAIPGGDTNVVAQRFDSSGRASGSLVQVGAGTFRETNPDVAVDDLGDFVVSYTRNTNNNNPDIFAKKYNGANQLLVVENVAISVKAETFSSVAMTPDGRFDVAWEQAFSSTDNDIYLSRFNNFGGLSGTSTISFSSANDELPSVSMDHGGNAVVAWQRSGTDIVAKRVGAAGTMSNEILISHSTASQSVPAVALKQGGGGFVVAYQSLTGGQFHTKVAEVSSSNSITTFDAGQRFVPAVSINGFDDYILTYTSPDGTETNIRERRGHLA